jgi:DHA1 family multidrug resistance protein-like MFS transporter
VTQTAEPASIRPLFLSLLLSSIGLGMSLPVVTLFAVELGAAGAMLGLIVAMRWIARLVVDVPVGVLSERIGRRQLFIGGIVVAALSGLVSALAPDPDVLLAARVLEGIGAGMSTTVALAMVADRSDAGSRGRMMGHYQSIQRIGFWFGPAIGGFIAAGLGLRASLWAYAALAGLAIIPALFVTEARRAPASHAALALRATVGSLLRSRDMVLVCAVSFAIFFTMTGTQFTVLPLFADELHLGPDAVGWSLFASNTVGFLLLYPTGALSDRGLQHGTVVVLTAIAAVGLVVMSGASDVVSLMIASVVLGFGNALRGPATQAYAIDAGGSGNHGATAGVFRAIGDAGSAAGPVLAALLIGLGSRPFFIVNAALLVLVALAFWRWASTRPGQAFDERAPAATTISPAV